MTSLSSLLLSLIVAAQAAGSTDLVSCAFSKFCRCFSLNSVAPGAVGLR